MCQEITYARIIHYNNASKISTDRLKGEQNKRFEGFRVGTDMEILIFLYLTSLQLFLVSKQGDLATASLWEKAEGITGITRVKDHQNMLFNIGSYDT